MNPQFNRYFIKTLYRKFRFPRKFVYRASRAINSVSPYNPHRSNIIYKNVNHSPRCPISINSGYSIFSAEDVPNHEKIITECRSVFEENRQIYDEQYFINNPKKSFLLTIASDEDLLKHNHINFFVKSDYVNEKVSHYLNQPYVLSTIRLWWTPINASSVSSQQFHLDEEDLTQVKVFMNISDVTPENGPFTLLPSNVSAKIISAARNGKRRYSDEEIYKLAAIDKVISLTGTAGSGAFVDTSKCLHYGSRNNSKERLVLMAQFLKSSAPLLKNSLRL